MDVAPATNINEVKERKPPPIVVEINVSFSEIQNLLGKECFFKRTSIGTKVFTPNQAVYKSCMQTLKENQIEFHSYNSKDNRLYTTFLHGLPRIKADDIKSELESYNLSPSAVTEIITKFSSDNNAVYKVQFIRKNFNPSSLKNVRTIANVIITWKKYRPKKNDRPTQCWNCLMYGHGGEHCHRGAACMICAENHHTNVCPFNTNEKRPAVFTCFNCKKHGKERTDHAANDINCPLRSLYLETRARVTTKSHNNNRVQQNLNTFQFNGVEFPNLVNTTSRNNNIMNANVSYANQLKNNSDLFSVDELFDIFTTAMEDLQRCTSKVQQIKVVMSMVKYAHGLH
ncbi:uncharacterized protein LOC119614753 [Lucilia sericata]|uniref:uncharacterized protein LOC119614753 n=1 Tax=Lucilia sericata TaxID=13632 RepID=UPI0018A7ED2A|nr:uncharacterized protein LOC119614753 [Lucilia sericata]